MRRSLIALAVLLAAAPFAASAASRAVPDSREQVRLSYAPLVRQAAPAVVNIFASQTVRTAASPLFNDPLLQRFFGHSPGLGKRSRVQQSLGSGVIIRPDGLIVTNHHVIEDADEIRVVLNDGREFDATLLLSDERTDLALLKVDPEGEALPHLEPARSDTDLAVGDIVLAIGNPFGVGQTVTSGIVSALARNAAGISDYNFFIQTDAAINPGNSGGALISMDGALVGINTAIYSRSGGSMGIGFAIPASMVRAVVASLDNGGRVLRPWLGAGGRDMTAALARSRGLAARRGVLIEQVEPDGPAARAGLRPGDVVTALDGAPVDSVDGLRFRVATIPIGGTAALTVLRDGHEHTLDLPAEAAPEIPPRNVTRLTGRQPLAGAVVANLSPALIDETGYEGTRRTGVVVIEVGGGTMAARVGIRPGDVIVSIDGEAVDDVDGLQRLLANVRGGWRLSVQRGDRMLEARVDARG